MLLFVFVPNAYAHDMSETPFFTVNGVGAHPNPLHTAGIEPSKVIIPHDIMQVTYLINQQLFFKLTEEQVSERFPESIYGPVEFSWDFGDGTKATGIENRHTYTSIGTKIVSIEATFPESDEKSQIVDQVILQVYPNIYYKLPKATISVDGQVVSDTQEVNLQKPLKYEATVTGATSTDLTYTWDFGDGTVKEGEIVVYRYKDNTTYVTPILQVTDENGFIVNSYITLSGTQNTAGTTFSTSLTGKIILITQLIVVVFGGGYIAFTLLKHKKKKHRKRR